MQNLVLLYVWTYMIIKNGGISQKFEERKGSDPRFAFSCVTAFAGITLGFPQEGEGI